MLLDLRIFAPDEVKKEEDKTMKTEEEKEEKDEIEGEEVDVEGEGEEVEVETPAQLLFNSIQSKVGINEALKPFTTFNLNFAVPRGKYDVEMYSTYVLTQQEHHPF